MTYVKPYVVNYLCGNIKLRYVVIYSINSLYIIIAGYYVGMHLNKVPSVSQEMIVISVLISPCNL